ncbi:MAG: hypothetical protein WCY76_04580, partial [Leucobacter sp.]
VQLPLVLLLALTLVVLAGAIGVCVVALRKRGPASTSLLLTSLGTLTAAALAETVIFWWVTGPMAGSEWRIPLLVTLGLAMWAAVFVQWIVVGRTRTNPSVVQAISAK